MKNSLILVVVFSVLESSQSENTPRDAVENSTSGNISPNELPEFSLKLFNLPLFNQSSNATAPPTKVNGANLIKATPEEPLPPRLLKFKNIGIENKEQFITAELHLYKKSTNKDDMKIQIIQSMEANSELTELIDEAEVKGNFIGWKIFNVTKALESPHTGKQNITLNVLAISKTSNRYVPLDIVRTGDSEMPQRMPIFVLFMDKIQTSKNISSQNVYES